MGILMMKSGNYRVAVLSSLALIFLTWYAICKNLIVLAGIFVISIVVLWGDFLIKKFYKKSKDNR
jgi:hypothetical protein